MRVHVCIVLNFVPIQYIAGLCPSVAADILYVKLECMVFLNANECYLKGHKTQVSISTRAWFAEKAKRSENDAK